MPTLDDAPIMPVITGTGASGSDSPTIITSSDLIQVYDLSTQKPKTITLNQLKLALQSIGIGVGATGGTGGTGGTGATGATGA